MKFRNIEAFLAVAETSSFSRAGENLGLSQSAVTLQIKELEKDVGIQLFDRLNKTVRLTAAGEAFSAYAKKILEDTDRILQEFSGYDAVTGHLRIAVWQTINMFRIPSILHEYHRRYPSVTVSLIEPSASDVFNLLCANEADLALMVDDPVVRDDMVCLPGMEEELCFVVSPQHPLAGTASCKLKDLEPYDLLMTTRNHTYHKKLLESMAGKQISFHVFMESSNTEPVKRLAERGDGIAFLPRFCVEDSLQSGRLVPLPVEDCSARVCHQVIYHRNKWVSPAMRAFLDLLAEPENGL